MFMHVLVTFRAKWICKLCRNSYISLVFLVIRLLYFSWHSDRRESVGTMRFVALIAHLIITLEFVHFSLILCSIQFLSLQWDNHLVMTWLEVDTPGKRLTVSVDTRVRGVVVGLLDFHRTLRGGIQLILTTKCFWRHSVFHNCLHSYSVLHLNHVLVLSIVLLLVLLKYRTHASGSGWSWRGEYRTFKHGILTVFRLVLLFNDVNSWLWSLLLWMVLVLEVVCLLIFHMHSLLLLHQLLLFLECLVRLLTIIVLLHVSRLLYLLVVLSVLLRHF